jgi:hypothetical protein
VFLSYITPTWITSLRQFLYTHNISITLTDTLKIGYSGSLDRCIMDTKSIQQYNPQQQRDINLVQLHLQALTLSDHHRQMETPYVNWQSKDIAKNTSASAATGPVKTTSRHPNKSSGLDTSRQTSSGTIGIGDSLRAT